METLIAENLDITLAEIKEAMNSRRTPDPEETDF